MEGFFKKFQKDKKEERKKENHNNPLQQFQNIFQPKSYNHYGGGVALGTNESKIPTGFKIVQLELKQSNTDAVGIYVEKNEKNSAIVSKVIPNSPGDDAGFMRGDVICFPGSQGAEEMNYDQFVIMLKERNMHALHFEVKRVVESSADAGRSADAFVKRQAMIAAAEERNKKNKPKTVMKQKDHGKEYFKPKGVENVTITSSEPMSEQSKKAVEAAKASEAMDVQNLGYNPYETVTTGAGRAKKTVVDVVHGEINNAETDTAVPIPTTQNTISPPIAIEPPSSIHELFDATFSTYLSSNNNKTSSLSILTKLITNALTKREDKFRRVRLSNPKISSNIVDVQGAMDIMMVFGFVLLEEDGETWLVYNCDDGLEDGELWKIQALEYMKQCL